jgi:hypothetical protein
MGYNLNLQLLQYNSFNFNNAVFAKFIQKSKEIKWQPDQITAIAPGDVNGFFSSSLDIPECE